jgi:predicted RNA-binding protein
MCEFKVMLNGEIVFEDVIYAKIEGKKVILKNILGILKEFENCLIAEVDVNAERLALSSIH